MTNTINDLLLTLEDLRDYRDSGYCDEINLVNEQIRDVVVRLADLGYYES